MITKPITGGLKGKRFGMLTIVMHVHVSVARAEGRKSGYWLARCDCGNFVRNKNPDHFKSGRAYSCGCSVRRPLGIGTGVKKAPRIDNRWLVLVGADVAQT